MERPQNEHELRQLLAATLVKREVLEPMEKIGWSHGAPPPPDYGTTPQTEGAPGTSGTPAAPAAQAAGQPSQQAAAQPAPGQPKADASAAPGFEFNIEDFKNPVTGKYFEKYNSPAEALKGLGHLAHMAKSAFSERDSVNARLTELESENKRLRETPAGTSPAAPARPSVQPPSRAGVDRAKANYDAVLSQIAEDGGILDAESAKKLSDAQSELSEEMAGFKLAENQYQTKTVEDADQAKWRAVTAYMTEHYPTSVEFADEIGLHIQSDPLLAEAVAALVAQKKEVKASELAWLSYERAAKEHGTSAARAEAEMSEQDLAAREKVREDLTKRALVDAGVVHGSAGGAGVHQNTQAAGSSKEEVARLAKEMARTGEAPGSPAAAAWRHAVIGRFLPPELFQSN